MAIKSFLRRLLWWKRRRQRSSASDCARCHRTTTATTLAATAEVEAHDSNRATVACAATTMTLRLDLLPDPAAHVLAELLDISSLCYLTQLLRDATTAMYDVFCHRVRLCIPPDSNRSLPLMGRFDPRQLPIIPAQVGLADSSQLTTLHRQIRGLRLDAQQYSSFPVSPMDYAALSSLRCLVRLEICYVVALVNERGGYDARGQLPIDLSRLSASVPQLQTLRIQNTFQVHNHGALELPELRVLKLENTNVTSFAVATRLPKLTSLTLLADPTYPQLPQLHDIASLAHIAPLECLVVRGQWAECPNAALTSHCTTLRTFAQVDTTCMFTMAPLSLPRVAFTLMTQLRSLRLGRQPLDDLSPLVALQTLEQLQLVVASTVPHCRHLRALTNLRELQLSRGWVMDIVGFLPHLDKLVCEQDNQQSLPGRGQICQATDADANGRLAMEMACTGGVSSLRKLVLRGKVSIDRADPVVSQWIHHVYQMELCQMHRDTAIAILETVRRLPHLKRLAFRDCVLPSHLDNHPFACEESLEELYIDTKAFYSAGFFPPDWPLTRTPKLRVLALSQGPLRYQMNEQIQLPSLTHLYMPLGPQYSWHQQLFGLQSLQVISICVETDCTPFRNERGPGHSLPALQRILHPMADCLWSPQCLRCHPQERVPPRYRYDKIVRKKVLVAPWSHPWEPPNLRERDDEDRHGAW